VAAGVQIEGARLTHQLHTGFDGELITFLPIAGVAASHQILPGGRPAARARNYVVKSKIARGKQGRTVLAGIAVTEQNILSRQSPRLVRNAAIFQQANHRGYAQREAGGVQKMTVLFLGHSNALQYQDDGAASGADIDRLVRCVEHQNGRMQSMAVAILMSRSHHDRRTGMHPQRIVKLA